ncbi:MAG: UDP-N-acetylmuramoyl-L-alanine--D-glutamate ligase [Ignavibacteriae bacterium]|nr:MAG: UDP-N-acetylmuramoyl-L-alanine--D-glutamate ligase [Ignavibacteriota bacterium]
MDLHLVQHKKISVIGAVRSGVAVAVLLKNHGARVLVSDSSAAEKLQSSLRVLQSESIDYETGRHSDRVFDCDLMVISPGVPSNAPVVVEAEKRKIKVVSELEVGCWFCRAPLVAITGSNGKTTTTTLTGRILSDAEKKHVVAGNIGTAFSSVVLDLAETDVAVLEVSSFQLDTIDTFRPKISVLLNITPDHMDRYDHSMEKYAASKARVFKNQRGDDVLIYNADDEWTRNVVAQASCRKIGFRMKEEPGIGAFVDQGLLVTSINGTRTEVIATDQIGIKGMHNLYNSMAAVLVGQLLGVEPSSMRSTLKTFEGVEHRLEFVRRLNEVSYYNDSKATNVDSVWYALQSFKEPIVLFLGGRDKGNDYSKLTDLVRRQVKAIVAIGESADIVERSFTGMTVVKKSSSMEEAVDLARFLAQPGDVVLLSPACASFDWFKNYEHRGEVFKQLVNTL